MHNLLSRQLNDEFIDALRILESRLTLIHSQPNTLRRTLVDPKFNKLTEKRDDFILRCILDHAQNYSEERKAFFSENTKQFGQQPVREVYREVGITYFGNVENLQGWLRCNLLAIIATNCRISSNLPDRQLKADNELDF
ncbi:MAG: hypothetical protein GDA56_22570 [Hormoscilla sp. GM7CHS1pb]|nr:hypothetical protein [Hormoscilla sp. GM7CHS1pb]